MIATHEHAGEFKEYFPKLGERTNHAVSSTRLKQKTATRKPSSRKVQEIKRTLGARIAK